MIFAAAASINGPTTDKYSSKASDPPSRKVVSAITVLTTLSSPFVPHGIVSSSILRNRTGSRRVLHRPFHRILQPVIAPEQFVPHSETRRAEDAELLRSLGSFAQRSLCPAVLRAGEPFVWIGSAGC